MCFKLIRHKDSRWNSKHSISMDLGRGEWSTLQLRLISAREEADMKEATGTMDDNFAKQDSNWRCWCNKDTA